MNPLAGIVLHAIGGFASGSFYIPFKKVKNWAWESYWIVNGLVAWMIVPWIVGFLTVPRLMEVLLSAPKGSAFMSFFFGILWGVGGLTFGLSMRYLGMSLGYAMALGYCAAFGTIVPPIYFGTIGTLASTTSGLVTLGGVGVCLLGIAICGWAGISKEREMSEEDKKAIISEFNFKKGLWVAFVCGIMSACFAFGIAAGKPIAEQAAALGTHSLFVNSPTFIFIMFGGFVTNAVWCFFLNRKNGTSGDYVKKDTPLLSNYFFCALAGTVWYMQFMFYGMGTTKMGAYDFSSWSIHMAFIIVFSNIWALIFREWRGSSRKTVAKIISGIAVLIVSTWVIGLGNYLASLGM